MEKVRIFIGCDPNDCDLEQLMVLHYSLRKHSSLPLDITLMQLNRNPQSFWFSDNAAHKGWNTSKWPTPFSAFRWGIPAFCQGQGRAVYMDADVMVLSDIAELWRMEFEPGKVMLASGQGKHLRLGTLVWNCKAAMEHLPPLEDIRKNPDSHKSLKNFFESHPELVQPLDPAYSNLDGDNMPASRLKLLHYSDMGTQFSHRYSLPRLQKQGQKHWFDGKILPHPRPDLVALFDQYYNEALEAGYKPQDFCVKEHFGHLPKKTQVHYKGNEITRKWFGRLRSACKVK